MSVTPQEFLSSDHAFRLDAIIVGRNGQKSAALTDDGEQVVLKLGTDAAPLRTPFGLSSFQDKNSNRVNLDLHCTEDVEQVAAKLDAAIVPILVRRKKDYWANTVTDELVRSTYRPS